MSVVIKRFCKKPMFEQMADEIASSVSVVVEKYRTQIKKRKCSPHLVMYWISEGSSRAKYMKPNPQVSRDGGKEDK